MELKLSSTSRLRCLLKSALEAQASAEVDEATAEEWARYSSSEDGDEVPYHVVRSAFLAVQKGRPKATATQTNPESSQLAQLHGCEVILPRPPERKRNPELEARLARLREAEERRSYSQLVKDVTRPGQNDLSGSADETSDAGPFSSFRQQLGFGLHVAAIMFTGYVAGQYLFARLFPHQPYMPPVGGALGLTVGMLVEAVLFIIQMSRLEGRRGRGREGKLERGRGARVGDGSSQTKSDGFQVLGREEIVSSEITEQSGSTSLRRRHRR